MALTDNEFWRDFIELFRREKILWVVKNDNNKNKLKRLQSWEILLTKYKEFDSSATIDVVKRHINGMRNCYRRELFKIKESTRSVAGGEDIYEPTLWYFYQLDFLREQEMEASEINTFADNDVENVLDSEGTRKRKRSDNNSEFLEKAIQYLDKVKNSRKERDDADVFAETWAILFRKLSAEQQIFAKRGIEEILLHGQLGNLNMNAVEINAVQRNSRICRISRALTPYTSSAESEEYALSHNSENSTSAQSFHALFTDTQL